jgi:hypothetical protein
VARLGSRTRHLESTAPQEQGPKAEKNSTVQRSANATAGHTRIWDEAVEYGFISGGGGSWYSNSLRMLDEGDRIWVNIPGTGFVGVGRVLGSRSAAREFLIDGNLALEKLKGGYHRHLVDDQDRSEYFVPVEWVHTVPETQTVREVGMFGNQNTVCRPKTPKWRSTVDRLKEKFGITT